ncbi:MAG: hypothetical protein IJT95_01320, partial [Abditibacteriota bacterium]|nr:hypothetical protein [Abditibacteriota bacterium]
KVIPRRFTCSEPRLARPAPVAVDMLTDNVVKLSYSDGAVEHWLIEPTVEDMENNLNKYPAQNAFYEKQSKNRALIWWNQKGEGCGDKYMAWNFNEDASKEPVYEGQEVSAQETTASANIKHVFSGLLARISGFFKGLFGTAAV